MSIIKALCSALLVFNAPALAETQAQVARDVRESRAVQATAVAALLARYHRTDAPGCAIGVYRRGEILHTGAFGMASLEFGVPITPKTVFYIASTSKQFTAASVVLLAQDGRLSLDDDIRKYLPEMPYYGTQITIRHLLNHTAGLRDYHGLLLMAGFRLADVSTRDEAYALITRQKGVMFKPGTRHWYSNSGHFLASMIVEKVSGQPFREFARDRIFNPLGMNSSLFRGDHTLIVPHRAVGYSPKEGAGYQIDVSNWEQVGDSGLLTTVEDFSKWTANFESGALGGKGLADALHTRGMLLDGSVIDYTIGLRHGADRGRPVIEHGGRFGGYVSHFRRFPAEGLTIAALCNNSEAPALNLVQSIGDVYLGSPTADRDNPLLAGQQPTARLSEAQLGVWIGEYRDLESGDAIIISVKDGALRSKGSGPTYTLRPASLSRFLFVGRAGAYAQFEAQAGRPKSMAVFVGDRLFQTFHAVARVYVSPAELARYAGNYRCSELNAVYRVEADDGALVLNRPRASSDRFLPWEAGVFHNGKRVAITFAGAIEGKPLTFRIDTPTVRGLRCDRLD